MTGRNRDTAESVVIVGAGIVGLCIALELLDRGLRVVLIDREPPGSQCSSGNAGAISSFSVAPLAMPGVIKSSLKMLVGPDMPLRIPEAYAPGVIAWLYRFVRSAHPQRVKEIADALHQLLSFSLDHHLALAARTGATQYVKRVGQLHLYRSKEEYQKDLGSWRLRQDHGAVLSLLDKDAIREIEPALKPVFESGVLVARQGMVINPLKYAQKIADAFRKRGGLIIKDDISSFRIEDRSIAAAVGKKKNYEGSRFVIAAGAWSTSLLRDCGYRVPLISQRGYNIDIAMPKALLGRPVCIVPRKVFLTPMDFGLRVAGTVELAGLRRPPDRSRARVLVNAVLEAFGQEVASRSAHSWMGHRPCLPDSLPVIGRAPDHTNLWLAFGHGHLGLTGSASTADILAREITGERTNVDLSPFGLQRFG